MDAKTVHIAFTLNGQPRALDIPGAASALQVIRDVIGLTGTKEGCGIGECGACTIEVDGKAVNSCLLLGAQLDGSAVLTVEGLAPEGGLHPAAGGVSESARGAVRFLHPRTADEHACPFAGKPPPGPRRSVQGDRRQPLPLHRLPADLRVHRRSRRARRRGG
ncbi:MAG: 2Fe-2S iron-sulfur cluster-binding protein [Desulfobacterales bacterium]|nr:2Fe-2S iron-sulfur cluster-binding protein [Desulfobacterales bacterium]